MAPSKTKPVIGIVGGIGSGKSSVAAEFAELGCKLIDADKIGHGLLERDEVKRNLVARWGKDILDPDGSINRSAVAKIVFIDPYELQALNNLLHPLIREQIEKQIGQTQLEDEFCGVILDAAVMFEAGWDELCTHKIFVYSPDQLRAQRVKATRGWDDEVWQKREKMQILLDKKEKLCDYTLDNSSNLSCLHERVRELFHQIIKATDCS